MSMTKFRENLTDVRTRWLTVGTIVGAALSLVGVGLWISVMIAVNLRGEPDSAVFTSATAFTTVGVVLTVIFSIALSRQIALRDK